MNIYIIYTPNLGSEIAIPGREREHGRFRGSIEGVRGRSEGAGGSKWGATGEHRGSTEGAPKGALKGAKGRSIKEPKLAAL